MAESTFMESPAVAALRSLSVFGADQAGAYREHFGHIREALGPDVKTKLICYIEKWAREGTPGIIILTGNAGTGKTAVAEAFCASFEANLPHGARGDELKEIAPGRFLIKDLSGLPTPKARFDVMSKAMSLASSGQVLICANEGVLRESFKSMNGESHAALNQLNRALIEGASKEGGILIVNLNRQRPTAKSIWPELIKFVANEHAWKNCDGCPSASHASESGSNDCPMQANAGFFRNSAIQDGMRLLFRYCSGKTVVTMRDVLSLLSWAIIGDPVSSSEGASDATGMNCDSVRKRVATVGREDAYDSKNAYFSLLFGAGLPFEAHERSPLLSALKMAELGEIADLEIDLWLRDLGSAPSSVRSQCGSVENPSIAGRYHTGIGMLGFEELGRTASISEDYGKVDACLSALCDSEFPMVSFWRRRVFFEAPEAIGGERESARRLLAPKFFPDLLALAQRCANGQVSSLDLQTVVKGLNKVVTGFPNVGEGLIIPENASLFSRDPGAFLPAKPGIIHSKVPFDRMHLRVPDRGIVTEILDVDHIEVELVVQFPVLKHEATLRIGPDIWEAIMQSVQFDGPVGRGRADMAEIRDFYDSIASSEPASSDARVADPTRSALAPLRLPEA